MSSYIILKTALVITLLICGYRMSKIKNSAYYYPYYLTVFPILIVYSCVEGLRYGRATDYFGYYNDFIGLTANTYEPIFQLFVNLLKYINAPFYIGFVMCSFLLIFSGCLFIKEYRFAAFFTLPIFYLDTIVQSSNLIRMYFALSIILIACKFLIQNKNYLFIFFVVIAFLTHYSSIILFPFILLFNKFHKPIKSRLFIIILFFLANYVTVSVFFLNSILIKFIGFGIYENYLTVTEGWLLNADTEKNELLSIVYYLRYYLTPIFILWYGFPLLEKYKDLKFHIFYHLYLIGVLFLPSSELIEVELFYRLALFFITFKFIVIGVILYNFSKQFRKLKLIDTIFYILIVLDIFYLIMRTILIYSKETGNQFIWDRLI
jgi:hypothetical protein